MRRIFVLLLALCAAVAASVVYAFAATPGGTADTPLTYRATHFYARGPGSGCDGDACGIGVVTAPTFRLPAGHTFRGIVTVSFTYKSTGDGIFNFGVSPRAASTNGRRGTVAPATRAVAPTRYPTSMTVTFRVTDLPGGQDLELDQSFGIGPRHNPKTSVTASNLVVELDLKA